MKDQQIDKHAHDQYAQYMLESYKNIVYDTNYTTLVPQGGFPVFSQNDIIQQSKVTPTSDQQTTEQPHDKQPSKQSSWSIIDKIFWLIGLSTPTKKIKETTHKSEKTQPTDNKNIANKDIKEQVQYLLSMPDEDYSDKKLTNKLRKFVLDTNHEHASTIADYKTHISPSYRAADGGKVNISWLLGRTYYTQSYPSYIEALRTRDILLFNGKRDMSFYLYPEDDGAIQSMLKTKATQLKAEINEALSKGITVDTELEIQYKDVETIRQKLATRQERYIETSFYMNIYEEDNDKLREMGKKLEQKVGGTGIKIKQATQRMDEWFNAWLPLCVDDLGITRSAITSSIAGSFPFISSDMITDTGILYGVNLHTGSLVIFDRFNSRLPNMNSVILATSWAWKSFTVKLEILRYLLSNIHVIVIDPENEYKWLVDKVGGTYINISTNSQQYINPFDLPPKIEDREYGKGDLLRWQILNLIGLVNILIGGLTPEHEALLDKALQTTYQLKWITMEDESNENKQPPIMQDLLNVLEWMEGAENIALRLSKYVTGTFSKIFNNYTNVDITNKLTVFSIRDLEDALKTPAMYNALNFIRTKVRSEKRKRMLVADEAWIMLQNETSANFLFGLIKRARKYGLWITTISQDIEDFMRSKYGKPIVSNSAFQILLKQSTTSIKSLDALLWLSEAEKQRLVAASVGEWLIFAGQQHVAVKILASPQEKDFITTDVGNSQKQ